MTLYWHLSAQVASALSFRVVGLLIPSSAPRRIPGFRTSKDVATIPLRQIPLVQAVRQLCAESRIRGFPVISSSSHRWFDHKNGLERLRNYVFEERNRSPG